MKKIGSQKGKSPSRLIDKSVVKMAFAKGAALKDAARLFNSSLDGNTRRAIDFHEGEKIDEEALKTLVRFAVTLNKSKARS